MNIELMYANEQAARFYEGDRFESGDWQGPNYGSADAAAFDLRACIEAPVVLMPGEQALIGTGIAVNMATYRDGESSFRMAALILPRSGLGTKVGLVVAQGVGLGDEDYQGEIFLMAWLRPLTTILSSSRDRLAGAGYEIKPGDRIGQLMFVPALRPGFKMVSEFSSRTARGTGGFGSTGNN